MTKFSVDREMRRAKAYERGGSFDEAKRIYGAILDKFPNNSRARHALALLGSSNDRKSSPNAAGPPPVADAESLVRSGVRLRGEGKLDEAIAAFAEALRIAPSSHEGHRELGIALQLGGRTEEAIECFRRAAKIAPGSLDAHMLAGLLLKEEGRHAEAIECFRQAVRIRPDSFEAQYGLGIGLTYQKKYREALECLTICLRIRPDSPQLLSTRGSVLRQLGNHEEAIESFRNALGIDPGCEEAHFGIGYALMKVHELNQAIAHFDKALRINPASAESLVGQASALTLLGDFSGAVGRFERAATLNPAMIEAFCGLGAAYLSMNNLEASLAAFEKALTLDPSATTALAEKLRIQTEMCDWRAHEDFARVRQQIGIAGDAVGPFNMLALEDCPERQLARARNYVRQNFRREPLTWPSPPGPPGGKIRIGYFSADFREHPMPRLIAGLFREHDRSRFEIIAYSFAPPGASGLRERVANAVDRFIDIREATDAEVVNMARGQRLDIAIDLMGYTRYARPNLFASRLAPIQINFLGFPGTMGAGFMDYIIADPVVLPEAERQFYDEKVIFLPHSYQPNDDRLEIDRTPTTRADFGLPETAFVFCCFNQTYKIGPPEFDIWMRVLRTVENSVLWLLPTNERAMANLGNEAQRRGVDPGRLVFASKLANPAHLGRHQHADLFLDTFNYNAHTTASDALRTGLPVVTLAGRQLASRVGASLLNAVGLPELITRSRKDYEALILELATNPGRLAAIKAKLAENLPTHPLFDTARYTRDFERALEEVHAHHMQALSGNGGGED